jgi:hypothetical protein
MDRYVKAPVEFGKTRAGKVWCQLHDIYEKFSRRSCGPIRGYGVTEDEAFTNLLEKLHYEEAKSLPNDLHDMFCRILDVISKCPIVDEGNEQLDSYAHTLVEIEHMVCDLLNREAE